MIPGIGVCLNFLGRGFSYCEARSLPTDAIIATFGVKRTIDCMVLVLRVFFSQKQVIDLPVNVRNPSPRNIST